MTPRLTTLPLLMMIRNVRYATIEYPPSITTVWPVTKSLSAMRPTMVCATSSGVATTERRGPSALQEAHLAQDGGVIPVDPLGGELVAAELHDHHHVELDLLPRGRY